ncbi:hypothetical protein R75461_01135 [Paraburkholderia nemoris]|uniref:hypothetical protein n=1 Tax=Paraburkholderia nemoris TaxID=2793076 RepID=UPI001AFE094B|nr:hypothetical protein [Paraburkholderia nemoris]CAE6712769.1 hypothetical protein R75461_01135 [Paraburkholderia nemoris]
MLKKIKLGLVALLLPLLAFGQSYPSPTFNNLTVNGTFTSTGNIGLASLAKQAANTVVANVTGSTASPTAFAMPSCSTSASALNWTTSTGFTCNTAVNAAQLNGATFAAPGAIGGTTPAAGTFTVLAATLTNHAVVIGGGTSAALGTAAPVSAGDVLTDNGPGNSPTFQAINGISGKNRIINPAMAIDQRNSGAAQTITAGAALAYTVDRWYGYSTGANVTGQRVAGSSASQFRYQYTGAASVTGIGFGQRIEQLNSYDLNNATATLSVDLADSLLTTVTWTAYYATSADSFGTLASPTRTQIATGTFTVTSTVTRYSTQISVPSAATTGIEIVFSVGAQTSGTWTIGNVQLEPGSTATTFERRPYGQELLLCQRYLPAINTTGAGDIAVGITTSTSGGIVFYSFKTTPRVPPTGITTANIADFSATTATNSSVATAISMSNAGTDGARISVTGTGTPYTSNNTFILFGNTAGGVILFMGSEL